MDHDWSEGGAQEMGRLGHIIYIQGLLEFDEIYALTESRFCKESTF
jgi:hypothetical protein